MASKRNTTALHPNYTSCLDDTQKRFRFFAWISAIKNRFTGLINPAIQERDVLMFQTCCRAKLKSFFRRYIDQILPKSISILDEFVDCIHAHTNVDRVLKRLER